MCCLFYIKFWGFLKKSVLFCFLFLFYFWVFFCLVFGRPPSFSPPSLSHSEADVAGACGNGSAVASSLRDRSWTEALGERDEDILRGFFRGKGCFLVG